MLTIDTQTNSNHGKVRSPSSPSKESGNDIEHTTKSVQNNTHRIMAKKSIPADANEKTFLIGISPKMPYGNGEQLKLMLEYVEMLGPKTIGAFPGEMLEVHNICIQAGLGLEGLEEKKPEAEKAFLEWARKNRPVTKRLRIHNGLHLPSAIMQEEKYNFDLLYYVVQYTYLAGKNKTLNLAEPLKFIENDKDVTTLFEGINNDALRYIRAHAKQAKNQELINLYIDSDPQNIDPNHYALTQASLYKLRETAILLGLAHLKLNTKDMMAKEIAEETAKETFKLLTKVSVEDCSAGYDYFVYPGQIAPGIAGLRAEIIHPGITVPIDILVKKDGSYEIQAPFSKESVSAEESVSGLEIITPDYPIVLQKLYKLGYSLRNYIQEVISAYSGETSDAAVNLGQAFIIKTQLTILPAPNKLKWLDIRISNVSENQNKRIHSSSSSESLLQNIKALEQQQIVLKADTLVNDVKTQVENIINKFILDCCYHTKSNYALLRQVSASFYRFEKAIEHTETEEAIKMYGEVPYLISVLYHRLHDKIHINEIPSSDSESDDESFNQTTQIFQLQLEKWLAQFIGFYRNETNILQEIKDLLTKASQTTIQSKLVAIPGNIKNCEKLLSFSLLDEKSISFLSDRRQSQASNILPISSTFTSFLTRFGTFTQSYTDNAQNLYNTARLVIFTMGCISCMLGCYEAMTRKDKDEKIFVPLAFFGIGFLMMRSVLESLQNFDKNRSINQTENTLNTTENQIIDVPSTPRLI